MSTVRETAVGLFVLIGLLCVAYLTIKLGKMEVLSNKGYELTANFDSVSGLRVGADVEMSGVPVGKVISISLDPDPMRNQAVVRLRLDKDLHLSDDSLHPDQRPHRRQIRQHIQGWLGPHARPRRQHHGNRIRR